MGVTEITRLWQVDFQHNMSKFPWRIPETSETERLNRMNFSLRGLAFKCHFLKGPPSKLANDGIDRAISWIDQNCKWLPFLGLAFMCEDECLKTMHVKRYQTHLLLPQLIREPTPLKSDDLHLLESSPTNRWILLV